MKAAFHIDKIPKLARAAIGVSALAMVLACGGDGASSATPPVTMPGTPTPPPTPAPTPTPTPSGPQYDLLTIAGDAGPAQIYDPNLEYTGQTGWLAYTKVDFDMIPGFPLLHTQIANSVDRGLNWRLSNRANESIRTQLTETDGTILDGIWRYETPAIVHTPDDIAAPWKLFAHKYFWTPARDRLFEYGWISMRTAAGPEGPWGVEEALFGTSFTPAAPFASRINIADLDPSLADMIVITEPGVLYKDGTLYLSLSGATSAAGIDRTFLLASDDQGQNWRYISNLITKTDAQALGAERYDGSSLVSFRGDIYLLVSPARGGIAHDGTSVFRFTDIATGQLERTVSGILREYHHIARQPEFSGPLGAGQSDYHEDNLGGVLIPQNDGDGPLFFQIFQTGEDILGN